MPSTIILGTGIFLTIYLLLLALRSAPGSVAAVDHLRGARRYVDQQIDAHLDELAREYEQACAARGGTDRFAQAVEAFIGEVVLDDNPPTAPDDEPLPIREFVVLEREYIYARILARLRGATGDGSPISLGA